MLFNKRNVQRNFKRNKDIILSAFGNAGTPNIASSNDLALAQSRARQEYDSIRRNFLIAEKQDDDSYEVNKLVTFNQVIKAEIEKYNLHLDDKKIHITDEERTKWNKYNDNITQLESIVSGHTNTLSNHTTQLNSLDSTISSHTNTLSSHTNSISSNTSSITSLQTKVSTLEKTISSLQTTIDDLTKKVNDLSKQ